MALGSSFGVTPAGLEEQAQRAKKRMPTQQALQTLSLALPKTLGANTTAPSAMMSGAYRPGGVPDSADAQMSRMVRAMSGGMKAGSARPVRPPRFTQTQSSRAPAAVPSPKPPAAQAVTGPLKPPTRPTMPARPSGGGYRDEDAAELAAGIVGSRGKPSGQLGSRPIDPTQVGGGLVDQGVSPPPPPQAPPPSSPPPGSGAYDTNDPYGPGGAPAGTSGYYDNQGNYHPMGNYQTARGGSGQATATGGRGY